jgi:DNA polymerase
MAAPSIDDRTRRIARQHAETARLLGVDFLPVRASPVRVAAAPIATDASIATAAPVAGDKQARLDALHERHDRECPHCTSVTGHTQTVFGEGDPDARLMFVGEAPGAEEDKQGRPFVGRSGQLLEKMINAMGLARGDVYIANVLKSRPPNNRTPTPDEAAACGAYLREQLAIIQPEVIVTLGRPAAQLLLDTTESMTNLRGRWQEYAGVPVMPTFHPAFLLRQYTKENRQKVWSDLQKAMERLEG